MDMDDMDDIDDIYDDVNNYYEAWGLTKGNPFTESAITLGESRLREVFTGRTKEFREVFSLLKSRERKRLLIYGWVGIGKTAFILQILDVLRRKDKKTLATYISLPPETDLATAALISLARETSDDEWAQHQLNQMGLRPTRTPVQKTGKAKAGISSTGFETTEETIPIHEPKYPTLSFIDLLERALKKYDRVVIAIDNLDKQDPARVRDLLRDAQGILKSGAFFLLTGHPTGLTRDILTRDLGLFDLTIELRRLDESTMQTMLAKYLNSVRDKPYDLSDSKVYTPFTKGAAQILCQRSDGVPRWLNRLGQYVLTNAIQEKASKITPMILQKGFEYADMQLRGHLGLTAEEYYVLELILEKGTLSDETITLQDLEHLKMQEFSEILPIIDNLVEFDLVKRLPVGHIIAYSPSPLLESKEKKINEDNEDDI